MTSTHSSKEAPPITRAPTPRILIAGTNPAGTAELAGTLEAMGYTIAGKDKTGPLTAQAAAHSTPDLVLMDLDAGRAFKKNLDLADGIRSRLEVPVLFICGSQEAARIPEASLCLPHGYLSRPFSETELRRLIDTALYTAGLEKKQRRSSEALEAMEARYRLLADHLQDVIFALDLDLNYTFITPSVKALRGYAPEELIGRSIEHFVTPASFKKARAVIEAEMAFEKSRGGVPNRFRNIEMELFCKDGTRIWTEAKFSILRDHDHRPVGFIGVNRDITERKRIHARLKESEEKFRTLAEACPFAIMIYQNDYWVYANAAAERISGFSKDDLYRMPFWQMVHPDHRELVRDRGSRRQSGAVAAPAYDFKIQTKQGETRWVSLSGSSFIYEGGPAGLITVIDITERKQAEAELRKSEEKHRAILENIEDGYYEVDLKGNFIFFNDFVCRISGYSREEVPGVNYREYTDEENAAKLGRLFKAVYETGKPAKALDLEIMRKDGLKRPLEISVSLIKDDSEQPEGFRGIIRDISERKQAEEQKARLEAQLQQAQKMEAIGTLAGGVAHDFNNILQAINGYTQLLLMTKSPGDPDYHKLTQLLQSGDRAAKLIDQLLTFSRKIEGECRYLSLNQEIQLVKKLLKQTIPRMIEQKMDLQEDLWLVNADPVRMEQILLNLGSNAADAMPEGGTLTIETRNVTIDDSTGEVAEAEPGCYVRLTVSDTGCGMDPQTVKHIFDPFFTTKAMGKGTGLGMASVYGIVKSHKGYILCDSRPNRGTAFRIYLPAVPDTDVRLAPPKEKKPPEGGTETILLVDDELPVREAAAEILEYFGYQVWCAADGETALDIFSRESALIHLVILDLSMPGMGGNQCLQEILKRDPAARVIISSGYAADGLASEALKSGACEFIGKPYQANDIAAKVRQVLDEK